MIRRLKRRSKKRTRWTSNKFLHQGLPAQVPCFLTCGLIVPCAISKPHHYCRRWSSRVERRSR